MDFLLIIYLLFSFISFSFRFSGWPLHLPRLGPPSFPILTNFLWLFLSPLEFESLLRTFIVNYGPIITLHIGPSSAIHKASPKRRGLFRHNPTWCILIQCWEWVLHNRKVRYQHKSASKFWMIWVRHHCIAQRRFFLQVFL